MRYSSFGRPTYLTYRIPWELIEVAAREIIPPSRHDRDGWGMISSRAKRGSA